RVAGKCDLVVREDVALPDRNGVPHELVFLKTAAGSPLRFWIPCDLRLLLLNYCSLRARIGSQNPRRSRYLRSTFHRFVGADRRTFARTIRRLHHGDIDGRRNEYSDSSGFDALNEPLLGNNNRGGHYNYKEERYRNLRLRMEVQFDGSRLDHQEVLKSTRNQLERELALEDIASVKDLPAYNMLM
ncbi:ELMO/CED-12 family, partial [Musa troglodytarum]